MRQSTVLGLLACVLTAVSMVTVQAMRGAEGFTLHPLLAERLGAPAPNASLSKQPAPGVGVRIDRSGFHVAGHNTTVALRGVGTTTGRWARYSHGVARTTSFGRETVVVTPERTEQFLTVDHRQGTKTWRWRLAAGKLHPIVGDDGAIGFWSAHTLAGVHVDPVAILDTVGRDVTPDGLRWSLARDRRGWLLELRVDDSNLPLPYVIDPAITYVSAAAAGNAGGATTLVINKPAGTVENNLLVAQVTVRGGTGIGAITSPGWTSTAPGWASLRQDYAAVNASQTFWKVAGAAEPANYTWSWGATSAKASGGIITLRGVDNASPVDQFGGSINSASTNNILAPSITTQTANTMLIGLFGSTSSPTTNVTPPASMTERYEAASTSGVSTRNEGATQAFAAIGATGTRTATTDQPGSSIGQLIALKLDITNPTGSVTAPAASANVRGNAVTVSSNSADGGSGVANAQFQRSPAGGGVWTNIGAADTTSPYSVAWDSTAVADGLYDLRVVTTDNAANTFTSALITNVRVDNTNPTGSLTTPASAAIVRGNAVTVSSNSADGGSGVASAAFQRSPAGAGVWTTISTDNSSPYSIAWDSTAVADGLYDLRVVTTDNGGLTFTSALITNVRVDNTNPTGAVTAPAASANVRGNAVTVSSNSADGGSGVANAQFQRSPAGAGVWTNIGAADTTSPYSVSWDSTAVADGLYDLRVITTDNGGLTFTSALITNVRVDNTNPTGAVTAPAASANVRGNAVTVSSNSADGGSGVANAQFQRSPAGAGVWTNIGAADTTSPYSVSWDSTAVADGLYDLRVITTDNGGLTFTSALITNVRVDNTNPTGSLTAPASAAIVRGNAVTVSSNSADGGSGVASAAFQRSPAGGGVWTTISTDNSSPYSIAWDTTAVADGLYDLRVVTTDNAGNTFTSALVTNVRVDNTNPTGAITAPAASANVRGNAVTVSSNSADGGSGVANAQFQRSPASAGVWTNIGAADTTSPYSVAWDSTAVADGLYDLRVVTTDNGGLTFTSALVTNVRVDNTNPTGSLTAPAASANVRGAAVTVSSDSADGGSGVASAAFQRSPAGAGVWTTISTDNSSPYSIAWDSTAVADGLYDLRVVTTDNGGLTFTSALITNVRVDNTNPTGAVTAPAASANVRGNAVTVSSNSADGGSGVANAQFQRSPAGAGVWTNIGAADTTSPYSVSWDSTAVADGLYDLRVITTDNGGLTFTSALITNVRVDNTNPTGSVTAPAASANVRGAAVTVSSDSADGGSGVASAAFQRSPAGAGVWTTISTDNSSPYSIAWDTTALADGLYDLRVITTDNAGNTFTSALVTNVRVDNLNPTGSLTAPSSGANLTGSAVTVSSNSADGGSGVANAQFQRSPAGGGVWTNIGAADTTSPYSIAWDTTAVADGLYDLRVVTTDNAGNTFTSALVTNVLVDNTNPTGSITAPATSANVRGSAVTVSSNSADAGSGVASAQFQRSPAGAGVWTNIGAADTTSPYSVAWDTTAAADGLYDLRVITLDNAGFSFTSALVTNVRVDNTNPTGAVTAPAASANVRGAAVTVSSDSADGGSGVASAAFQRSPAGAGVWTTISTDNSSPYSIAWDSTAVADGLYDLRVVTTDNAGNTFTSALVTNVRVDNTNPTGSITAPVSSANVGGAAVTVSSNSADGGSGVASAAFERSPAGAGVWTTISTDNSSPYSIAWDTTALADGLYDLRVVTTDNAGNTFTSALVTNVRVDNSNPTGSITAPASSASVGGAAVTVSSNSADGGSGVASAQFQRSAAGAGVWTNIGAADTTSPYSVAWDSTAVADGLYDLRVITTDNVGNTVTSALVTNVRVDNTNPTGGVTAPAASANVRGAAVTVSSDSADGGSGVANAQFQRSSAGAGVWTNIGAADTTSPYSVAWNSTAVADGLYDLRVITADSVGNSFTSALVTNVRVDNTNPTGSISAPGPGANVTGSAVPVSSDSADGGSGVASAEFQRSPAGAGVWTTISTDNSSPYSIAWDTTALADGSYDLQVISTDNAGNAFTSAVRTVTVDNSAPAAPALSFGSFTNASATGATVYYRTGVAGGFTVTGTATDLHSGIDHLTFPGLGSGWTGGGADTNSPYDSVYTFNGSAADPTEPNDVTATNNVAITSSPTSFTVTPDSLAPVSSILCDGASCAGGWYTSSVAISVSASDGGSGVQEIRYTTDGSDPSPINGNIYVSPFSVLGTTTVKFRSYDVVGNEEPVASQLVRIDTSAPSAPVLTLSESPTSGNEHVSGTTIFYNPQGGNSGSFTVDASAGDPESGIEKITFPFVTGMTGGGDDVTSPYQALYSWTASTSASGGQDAIARNNAGLTSSPSAFTVTPDTTAPASQTTALVGGPYYTTASVGFTTGDGSDAGSNIDTASRLVERAEAPLTNGNCTGGFSAFGGSHSSPDTSVVSGNCYRYRFTVADNVGNVSVAVITGDAKVDTSAPNAMMDDPGANLRGTVSLTSTTSDPESGLATVTYERSPAGVGTWTATSASWDTTGVAEGLYDLRVVVTNNAGSSTTSALVASRRVDNTAPSASMDDPGSPLSDIVPLTSTASDVNGSGLDAATFQYSYQGTGPWTTIGTDSSAPFGLDWDTNLGLDGRYNLRVIVTDVAGNSTTSSTVTNRKIQNLPPLVDITSPGNYINAASPSPFTITVTTEALQFGVDHVEFFRCTDASVNCSTGTFASIGIDFTDPYTGSWAQASEPEGNRALNALVVDGDGGTGEDVFNVIIDRTAPTGSITAPGSGAYVGGTTVAVSSDSADTLSGVTQVVFQRSPAGQGTWTALATDTTSPYSLVWNTTSLADGAFDLRAVTTDMAGNSFNGPATTVNVDNTGPMATQDDPGTNLRAGVTLTGSASDPAGIAQVTFQRSPAGQSSWTTIDTDASSPYSVSFDTTGVVDGLYDFRVVATDSVGNASNSTAVANRSIDNTNPTATQNDPGANLRAGVTLTASAADTGGSGIAQVVFQRSPAGAGTWTAIDTDLSAPYSVSFDTTAVSDGLYDLRAVATDVAGNSVNSTVVASRRIDNTPPGATMHDPGANLNGTVGLTSTTSDGGSGLATVTYEYSLAGQSSWTATPASWDTTVLGDGLYDLRVIATDVAGNSTTSAPVVNRRVDNGVPTISITSPTAYVNGGDADPFTVTAFTLDTDLAGVQFFTCDNASVSCSTGGWISLGTDATAPYSVSWALPGADGNRALRAVATDLSSNTGQDVRNVTIDRTAPSGGSVSYLDGYDTTGSLTITTDDGTDSVSGVDPASGLLERDSATLANGVCGSFASSWTTVTSPDSVMSGSCYRYRYGISDIAGNRAMYTSLSVAKIDTSAPADPTFSFSAFSNAALTGGVVYFRSGTAGGFTVAASSSDGQSGIAGYAFPGLGSGWSGSQSGASYDYTFNASAGNPVEPNNVTVQNNAGLTSGPTSFAVTPDGSAPTSSISCDGAPCVGTWYTTSVSISLSADDGSGSGLEEIRYTTDGSDPSPVNGTVYSTPFSVVATTVVKFRSYDAVGNEGAVGSQLVQIDDTAPSAPALTLSESPASPKQHVLGSTIFYNPQGGNSGTFRVDATTSDAQSGIDMVSFPSLTGMTGGGDDSSSPYQRTYSWTASSSASGSQSVASVNNAGLSTSSSFTVTPDTAPPGTGFVSYPGGYASGSVTIATDDGTDALSGVNAATGVLERNETLLVSGNCDPFTGPWTAVSSPDSTITSGHCYQYRYRVSDYVDNEAVYTSASVVKVSTGAPGAPDLTLAETPGSPNQFASGTTLFYNPTGGNNGTFTATADVTDSGGSGVDKVTFPSLSGITGGGDDTTSPYQGIYDWTAGSSASGAQTVSVVNNAGFTSQATFTLTVDAAPPTGHDASIAGGYYTSLSVPVTLQDGTDALSGVDPASGVVERESGTLAGGSCAWGGTWSSVTLSGGADTTVASNNCYRYRYLISDRVGNQALASAASLAAKVDATTPITSDDAPGSWQNSPVTVTLSVNETGSGVASTVYRVDGSAFQGGTSVSIPAPVDHSNDGVHAIEYRSTDNAGNVETLRTATVRIDTTIPTTTDDAPAGWRATAVNVTLSPADALSGIASTQYRVDGGVFQGGTSVSIPAPVDHSNDGAHTVEYRSTDTAGNVEPLRTATVRIDTTLPAGALTTPADGAHVNGAVAISASASDLPSGVASVEFLVRPNGSGSFTSISTDTSAPYDASWSSTGAPEGSADLKVVVLDNAGLSVTSAISTVVVDNPPLPTLGDPGANVSGTVTLTSTSPADTAQVVFERSPMGAGTWTQVATDTSAPFSADFDTSSVGDGQYDLRAVATDLGGFDGTSVLRTSRVDNTAPTVSVSDPASGAVVAGANVHVAATSSDLGSGVSSVRFEQRPAGSGAFTAIGTDTAAPYEASWDATGLGGGYELQAVATDLAGNQATGAMVTVTVDATAPTVTLGDPGSLVHGVVGLSATAPNAAVASVSFDRRSAGGAWTRIVLDTTRPWSAAFDTKSVADGVYDLRAQALGGGGQVLATHSRAGITIDNTTPTLLSANPADGSVVTPVTSIALVASEPVSAVQGATLDGAAATAQISGSNVTFSTSPLGAGAHKLTGALVDAAGNSGVFSVHFRVKVKAHAPLTLRVGKPKTRTLSHGAKRVVRVSVSLSGPARVRATLLSPTGRPLRKLKANLSAGRHSLRFVLPSASLPPGRYTILVVATAPDGSRLVKRVYVTIVVKQQPKPTKTPESDPAPQEVVFPVAPASGPDRGDVSAPPDPPTPPAHTEKPKPKKHAPPAKGEALETASGYVSDSKPGHTVALVLVLFALGAMIAFLIKREMGRMVKPRR